MKTLAIVLPSIVLAFAVGFLVTTEGAPSALFAAPAADTQNVAFMGHVEFIQKNAAGDTIGYYQSDNKVMDDGKDCSAIRIFHAANGLGTCASSGEFQYIAIGNATCVSCEDGTRTTLQAEMDNRLQDTSIAAFLTASDPSGTTVVINTETPFTIGTGNETNNIFEAGLFDAATGGNVFAIRNTTAATPNLGIDVNSGDTLDVTWTITVG